MCCSGLAEIGLLLGAVGVVLGRVGAPEALAALPNLFLICCESYVYNQKGKAQLDYRGMG